MQHDAVVIGSGVSGLTAALLLARQKRRVAVLEQHTHAAPLLRRFRRESRWCDPGFHYIGGLFPGGGFPALLDHLGILQHLAPLPFDPDATEVIHLPDTEPVAIPLGIENVREALCEHFPTDATAVNHYLKALRETYHATPFASLQADSVRPAPPLDASHTTLSQLLHQTNASPGLARTLDRYAAFLTGADAERTSFFTHAMVLGSNYQAAHGLARGGDEIVDALLAELDRHEVPVLTGRRVHRILDDGNGCFRAVETVFRKGEDPELHEAALCIATIHPRRLLAMLPPQMRRPNIERRIGALADTWAPFAIHLACDEPPPALRRTNHGLIARDDAPLPPAGFPAPRDLAVMAPMTPDAPTGEPRSLCLVRQAWFEPPDDFYAPAQPPGTPPRRPGWSPARIDEYSDYLTRDSLGMLEQAFPELRGRYSVLAVSSPWSYDRYTLGWHGAIYGSQPLPGATPPGARTPLRGLRLAGQSLKAPGVMGAVISAFLAVGLLDGSLKTWEEIRQCH